MIKNYRQLNRNSNAIHSRNIKISVNFNGISQFVDVENYHVQGACLRVVENRNHIILHKGQHLPAKISIGEHNIFSDTCLKVAWVDHDVPGRFGVEFIPLAKEFIRRSSERIPISDKYQLQVSCIDPLDPSRKILFKSTDVSRTGIGLVTSLSNKHLLPGMRIKQAKIYIPGYSEHTFDLSLKWARVSEKTGDIYLGAPIEHVSEKFYEDLSAYLANYSQKLGCSLETLRNSGFQLKNIKSEINYNIIDSEEQYQQILHLRYKSYSNANKTRSVHIEEMGDGLKNEGLIVGGYLGNRLISSVEVRYGDKQQLRFQNFYMQNGLSLQDLNTYVEISKLCIDPLLQRSDCLIGMFQKLHALMLQEKTPKNIISTCTKELLPMYQFMGFKSIGTPMVHPVNRKFELYAIILEEKVYTKAHSINPVSFQKFYLANFNFFHSAGLIEENKLPLLYNLKRKFFEPIFKILDKKRRKRRNKSLSEKAENKPNIRNYIASSLTKKHLSVSVIAPYIKCSDLKIGEEKTDQILLQIGLGRQYLTNKGNWLSIKFLDKFLDEYKKYGDIAELSAAAGNASISEEFMGINYTILKLFINPMQAFRSIEHIIPKFNTTRSYKFVDGSKEHAIIKIGAPDRHLLPKHRESCKNWSESFESYLKLMTGKPGIVRELSCCYDGHQDCTYILKWKNSKKYLIQSLLKFSFSFAMIMILTYYGPLDTVTNFGFGFLIFLSLLLFNLKRENDRGKETISKFIFEYNQFEYNNREKYQELQRAKELVDIRYKEAHLLEKTLRLIQSSSDSQETMITSLNAVCDEMEFDRAFIMTVDKSKNILQTSAISKGLEKFSELWKFKIDVSNKRNNNFYLSSVYLTGQSIIIDKIDSYMLQFNDASKQLIMRLKPKGFIAVQIPAEHGEAWGVLVADKYKKNKNIEQSDMVLLNRLARHIGLILDNQFKLEREQQMRHTFQKYVPGRILSNYVDIIKPKLGGEERQLVSMFADVRGFTALSEQYPAPVLVKILNDFFKISSKNITAQKGIIEKFLGDGFMASFFIESRSNKSENIRLVKNTDPNLPPTAFSRNHFGTDEVDQAIESALNILKDLTELNHRFTNEGMPAIEIGIGMHIGQALVGNIGSEERMEFTSMGSTVNMASRLEGLCKSLKCHIVISEQVYKNSKRFQSYFNKIEEQEIKGSNNKVAVYCYKQQVNIENNKERVNARIS